MQRCHNCGYPHPPPGETVVIVEARDAAGKLVLDPDKQPPWIYSTERELTTYFWRHSNWPTDRSATMSDIRAWFHSRGWSWRVKTW